MNNSTKDLIRNFIKEAAGKFFPSRLPPFKIDVAKKKEWGDLSTNLPFLLAGKTGNSPEVMGKNPDAGICVPQLYSGDGKSKDEFYYKFPELKVEFLKAFKKFLGFGSVKR